MDTTTYSIDDLRRAAEAGTLRGLRGLSARTEQLILEGIDLAGARRRPRWEPRRRVDGDARSADRANANVLGKA